MHHFVDFYTSVKGQWVNHNDVQLHKMTQVKNFLCLFWIPVFIDPYPEKYYTRTHALWL